MTVKLLLTPSFVSNLDAAIVPLSDDFITRHSLVRVKGEVFVLLYVFCSLFVNDFSTTRGPIHAKFCMRA